MLLEAKSLTKRFKHHLAVDQLSLCIDKNECVALLGPNGAGKTTTLEMLAGLLTPDGGSVQFLEKEKMDRQHIGYLPQYPSFFPWMSAEEFLRFAGRLSGVREDGLSKRIEEMLHFTGLEEAKKRRIGGFSGGMKQRLGLAQALIHEPELLILDEPVSALDPAGRRDVLKMMSELKSKMAILFSTHVLHDAEQVCDQVVMLQGGKMKWTGSLQSLRERQSAGRMELETKEAIGEWPLAESYMTDVVFRSSNFLEVSLKRPEDRNRLIAQCMERGLTIMRFEEKGHSLESAFLELMAQ